MGLKCVNHHRIRFDGPGIGRKNIERDPVKIGQSNGQVLDHLGQMLSGKSEKQTSLIKMLGQLRRGNVCRNAFVQVGFADQTVKGFDAAADFKLKPLPATAVPEWREAFPIAPMAFYRQFADIFSPAGV